MSKAINYLNKLLNEDTNLLPQIVYRGSSDSNKDISTDWKNGVYISTDKESAAQYGKVTAYKIIKQPNLLNLNDWNATGSKKYVGMFMKMDLSEMSLGDFDEGAADLFIQGDEEIQHIMKNKGWNGIIFGKDAFLFGKLSDYAEEIKG